MSRLENWQRHPGLAELKRDDRRLLAPQFARLARDARSVADLVDELWPLELLEPAFRVDTVTVDLCLDAPLPSIRADPDQIRQVLVNLITNASEAIGEQDGVIRVSTERATLPTGEYIRLEVSDTGCSIAAEIQTRIFRTVMCAR